VIARVASAAALAVAAVAAAVILLGSGSSPYVIRMRLADANGLRQGSPVAIAGQDVGTINMRVRQGRVIVSMDLDRSQAPVGRNATATVASVNLLGQKRIELSKGDLAQPARSGYTLPASQVTVDTDLNQVLDVLTPDVRTRLGILINEAGQALVGRRADVSEMLAQMPADFSAGSELLNGISSDNHTLAQLVSSSEGFVSELASQHAQVVSAIDVLGQASRTVAAKRAQLTATLARAPGTLGTLRAFLVKLQRTTVPLGPAAQDITQTAPALDATLAQLSPFRRAADPTLREATSVAPELTRLAAGATPVIERAAPVLGSLAAFSTALAPVSAIVQRSADNLVAILQNWSRAIQFRDGLSHVFRGEASFTPQTIVSMLDQLQQAGLAPASLTSAAKHAQRERAAGSHSQRRSSGAGQTPAARRSTVPRSGRPSHGALGRSATASGSTATTSSATTPAPAGGLAHTLGSLLSYLLGP
jgi:phospholipid/cholesterol/gamma-HCH transport system substrate-binding protein